MLNMLKMYDLQPSDPHRAFNRQSSHTSLKLFEKKQAACRVMGNCWALTPYPEALGMEPVQDFYIFNRQSQPRSRKSAKLELWEHEERNKKQLEKFSECYNTLTLETPYINRK